MLDFKRLVIPGYVKEACPNLTDEEILGAVSSLFYRFPRGTFCVTHRNILWRKLVSDMEQHNMILVEGNQSEERDEYKQTISRRDVEEGFKGCMKFPLLYASKNPDMETICLLAELCGRYEVVYVLRTAWIWTLFLYKQANIGANLEQDFKVGWFLENNTVLPDVDP